MRFWRSRNICKLYDQRTSEDKEESSDRKLWNRRGPCDWVQWEGFGESHVVWDLGRVNIDLAEKNRFIGGELLKKFDFQFGVDALLYWNFKLMIPPF